MAKSPLPFGCGLVVSLPALSGLAQGPLVVESDLLPLSLGDLAHHMLPRGDSARVELPAREVLRSGAGVAAVVEEER